MECNLCGKNARKGSGCEGCPDYGEQHYVEGISSRESSATCFCVAESPLTASLSRDPTKHPPWSYDVEQSVKKIFSADLDFRSVSCRFTYAVRCEHNKPTKKHIVACRPLFHEEILSYSIPDRPIMVFALGAAVLKAFDIKQVGYKKVLGKFIEAQLNGRRVIVFPSLSKRQLMQNASYLEVLKRHVSTFLTAVRNVQRNKPVNTEVPTQTLTENYVFPKTLKQLREVTEMIINYAPEGMDPRSSPLAIDTETNTVYPHRDKLKILTLVVSWAPQRATSIPIEHSESPFTLEQVAPYVQRILSCDKPKLLHNAKFDIRVLERKGWSVQNFSWDTMVAEHLLEEDKKGFYSLKELVRNFLPRYQNYEEDIQSKKPKRSKDEETAVPQDEEEEKLSTAGKKLRDDLGYAHIPLKDLNTYGAIDADVTRQIAVKQVDRMRTEQKHVTKKRQDCTKNTFYRNLVKPPLDAELPLKDLMHQQMVPVIHTLARMESAGIRVDHDHVSKLRREMNKSLSDIDIRIRRMVPSRIFKNFNPASTKQLSSLLFAKGYIHPKTKKLVCYKGVVDPPLTPTGQVSTNKEFLRSLVTQYDCLFTKAVLEFRAIQKARNTFLENISTWSQEDGRMHTTYNPHGTSSGRTSSANENMQNVPTKIGPHNIKKCFIPTDPDRQVFIQADAKAAEVRIYAAYSRDKNLITALNDGMDPHSFFSSMVLNPDNILRDVAPSERQTVLSTIGIDDENEWSYEDFEKRDYYTGTAEIPGPNVAYGLRLGKLRNNIKRVVFGILYGAYKAKIASIVGITDDQAQAIIDSLFKMFPTIERYIQNTKDQVSYMHMVETFFGRRRRFPNWDSMTYKMRNKAERQAVNFKIQSTSSEIVMRVLAETEEPMRREFGGRHLITVHDSVVLELPKEYISQMPDFFEEYGVNRVAGYCKWLPVPFKWDVDVGPSYGELQPIAQYLQAQNAGVPSLLEQEREDTDYLETEILKELATA